MCHLQFGGFNSFSLISIVLIKPFSLASLNQNTISSLTNINKQRDKESPYLNPLSIFIGLSGEPSAKIDKKAEQIHDMVHLLYFLSKPHDLHDVIQEVSPYRVICIMKIKLQQQAIYFLLFSHMLASLAINTPSRICYTLQNFL